MDENQLMEVEGYPASISDSEETQVNSFARLATRVLQSVDNAESLILDLQYSIPPSESSLGAIRGLSTHDRDEVANDALETLRSITEHVQLAHNLSIRGDNNKYLKEAKLRDHFEYISRQLDKLLQSLLSSSSPSDKWKALEKFNRVVRKSMKGSALASLSSLASLDSGFEMLGEAALPPAATKPPDTIGLHEGMCPLERSMANYSGTAASRNHKYLLDDFVEWARSEYPSSTVHSEIGAIRTVFMFREPGGLHHEYVLISFGDGEVEESWLRAERAADIHKQPGQARKDNPFTAIVGGAVLRQTITFSRSRSDLTPSEDTEFVSIVVDSSLPSSSPKQIHLNELGTQFVQVSTTSNLYLLFTENCRWFARRNVLSIMERLSAADIGFSTSWHNQPCPYTKIRGKLTSGPFSGWLLYGSKSTLIEAKGRLDHAWTLLAGKQYPEAVARCKEAHALLSSVRVPSLRRQNLCSTASSLLAQGLYGIGEEHWREGLKEHRKAYDICHALRVEFEEHYFDTHNSFAAALLRMGQTQEAIKIWTRLLADQRVIHAKIHATHAKIHAIMSADGLAIFLFNYSLALNGIPGCESSRLKSLEEAISLRHDLYEKRWDLYSKTYAAVLDEYAHLLDISNRSEEAFEASEKAVAIMRADYEHHPDSRNEFARCLYNHARYAARLEEWRKARMIGMKCVQHRRFLFIKDGGKYDVDLAKALENLGRYNLKVKRPNDGFDCLIEALQHRRSCYAASDGKDSGSKPLAKLLTRMAVELDTAKESGYTLPQSGTWNSDALRREASKVGAGKKLKYEGRHREHS